MTDTVDTPDDTPDGNPTARSHTSWQVLAEGFALFVMGVAPLASGLAAVGLLTGDRVPVPVAPGNEVLAFAGARFGIEEATILVTPTTSQAWAVSAIELAGGLFVAAVAWLVYRILVDAREEPGPFRNGMAGRLFRLALVILAGGMVLGVLDDVPHMLLTPQGAGQVFHVSFLPVWFAGFVGTLAEVFRRGEAMQEDVEGLV